MNKIPCPSEENAFLSDHVRLILDSYQHFLGVPLIPGTGDYRESARQLFHASFALVSHNTNPDPVFNYANQVALNLFEFGWDEFSCLPSRLSAAQVNQIERDKLLAEVAANGFISHYQGVRVSKQGKRFKIFNAAVWNLLDCDGVYKGQAAFFKDWTYL
jgi:MEKHLA domain